MVDYGTFEEITTANAAGRQRAPQTNEGDGSGAPVRVRLPREGELLGIVVQRLGGNKMEVHCSDGKRRNCRVPGRFKRSMWLRPKDIVLVQCWNDEPDKADVIFHYHSSAVNQLRKRGLLEGLKVEF